MGYKTSISDFKLDSKFLSLQMTQNLSLLLYPVLLPWIWLTSLWPKLLGLKRSIIPSLLMLYKIVLVSFSSDVTEIFKAYAIKGHMQNNLKRWLLSDIGASQWKFWLYMAVRLTVIICNFWSNYWENIFGMRILYCFHILVKHHLKAKSWRNQYTILEICYATILMHAYVLNNEARCLCD